MSLEAYKRKMNEARSFEDAVPIFAIVAQKCYPRLAASPFKSPHIPVRPALRWWQLLQHFQDTPVVFAVRCLRVWT